MSKGMLTAQPFDMDRLPSMQPGQARRKQALAARLMALVATGRPRPRFSGFGLGQAARKAGAGMLVKEFLGLCRRSLTGRLD